MIRCKILNVSAYKKEYWYIPNLLFHNKVDAAEKKNLLFITTLQRREGMRKRRNQDSSLGEGFLDDSSVNVVDFISEKFNENIERVFSSRKSSEEIDLEQHVKIYRNNNDESSFENLYRYFKPHFERIAFQKKDEDLVTELAEVLWNATLKYDFDVGVKFKTFFWTCAQNHIGTKKIRENAKKRTTYQIIQVSSYNEETGQVELSEEVVKLQNISLNLKIKTGEDSSGEISSFIESKLSNNDYVFSDFNLCLQSVFDSGLLKEKEKKAIELFIKGYTLNEIGHELGGLTAPAIHFMFKRLRDRDILKDMLIDILK
jgi:DNA-directed RNA polymerase specialized sigma subunit